MSYPRVNYEMTEAELEELLDACKPVPYMVIGGCVPSSPQENANRAWQKLGDKHGFDYMTVRPIQGKGTRFFSAVPSETPLQREERLRREEVELKQRRIEDLKREIEVRKQELERLESK
ncbi:MAG: hypothetical protein WC343_06505 [Bacilli bacterium]